MQVHGLVVCIENGAGIPNIVAAAYDGSTTAGMLSQHPRLGSAISDAAGQFTVTIDNGALKVKVRDVGVSFVIALFAPEDAFSDGAGSRDLSDRLLHLSEPVTVSGVTAEAVVVRLPVKTIAKFKLQVGSGAAGGAASSVNLGTVDDQIERYVTAALNQQKIKDGIDAGLAAGRKTLQTADGARRKAGKGFAAQVTALPVALRDPAKQAAAHIIVGKANVAKNFAKVQRSAIDKGLAVVQKMTLPKPLVLQLTDQQAAALGINVSKTPGTRGASAALPAGGTAAPANLPQAAATVKMDPKAFFAVVRQIVPSYDLFFPEPPPTAQLNRLEKRYLIEPTVAAAPANAAATVPKANA